MSRLTPSFIAAVAVLTAGCGDAGSPTSDPQINFNLATRRAAASSSASAALAVAGSETFTDGANTLVLDRVDIVLHEIELKRSGEITDCDDNAACQSLELGPALFSLPLGVAGASRAFSITVPAGTYDEVEFKIRPPSGSDDAAFLQANPDFAGVSVLVAGTFNGTPFEFHSDLEAEEGIDLTPELVTTAATATELTLFIDLDTWFRDSSGNLVDPTTAAAGQTNETLVEDNIRRAVDAFEDDNQNGVDDNGEGEFGDQQGGADDGSNET